MNGSITSPWSELNIWFSSILVHLVETEQVNTCSMSSASDPSRNFSHLRKTKACSVGGDAWVCSKALQHSLSFCPTWPMIKIGPFSSCMKNTDVFMHYRLAKKFTHSYVHGYRADWIAGSAVSYGLDLTNKFDGSFLILNKQSETSKLLYLCSHLWTHSTLFKFSALSLNWHSNTLKTSHWWFWCEY